MFPDALRARGVKLEDFTLVSAKKNIRKGNLKFSQLSLLKREWQICNEIMMS